MTRVTQPQREVFLQAIGGRCAPLRLQLRQTCIHKARLQRADTLHQRRMGGKQAGKANPIAKQHVADFLGIATILQARAVFQAGDFFQRAGQPCGLAGELHGAGVGQPLARAADPGLDHAAEEQAHVANHERDQGGNQQATGIAIATTAEAAVFQNFAPDQAHHQDAEQHPDQADVQAHVAIENMTELMRDHALQLIPIEPVQRAPGHRHHRIRWREPRRKGIDGSFVLQHVELGYWHAGGNRNFFHHIAQPPQRRVGGVGRHPTATHLLRHCFATTTQAGDAIQRTKHNRDHGDAAGEGQHPPRMGDRPHHRIHRTNDAGHCQHQQDDQPRAIPARCCLVFEKIHAQRSSPDQNCTLGASRTCACLSAGMSSKVAARNPKMPAKMALGNTSRLLL